jgi:Glyoxalase superfamily protein
MRSYRDAKDMAKTLKEALAARNHDIRHAEALEIVARQFGLRDWNTLAARIDDEPEKSLEPLPEAWIIDGERQELYRAGIVKKDGAPAALVSYRRTADDPEFKEGLGGYISILQIVSAEAHRGKRLELAADLACQDVFGAGTLWIRIEDAARKVLAFDNNEQRRGGVVRDTKGWERRNIVVDVPEDADTLFFGFYLRGSGSLWVRNYSFAAVTDTISPTAKLNRADIAPAPRSLDFRSEAA